jgi:hypothetical protein
MSMAGWSFLTGCGKRFEGKLAQCFEHGIPRLALGIVSALDQARIHQHLEGSEESR